MQASLSVALLAMGAALCSAAHAQEFSRFLRCEGTFTTAQKSTSAHADFALRFASRTAQIQRSNVLPVGERLQYTPSPTSYAMTYRLPAQGTTLVTLPGWVQSSALVFLPDLRRLNQIRMSIDRQNGKMEGQLLNEAEQSLGSFEMQCTSQNAQEVEAPKF